MLEFGKLSVGATADTAVANFGGAMEADTISKHGRSLKSHTSKGNFLGNIRKTFFVVAVGTIMLFSISSCKTVISTTTLHPKMQNEQLLPPLTPVFDTESFGIRFPLQVSSMVNAGHQIMGAAGTYDNPNLTNFRMIFQRDVEKNICRPNLDDKAKGTIKCSLVDAYDRTKEWWLIPSLLSGFTLNLLGMPRTTQYDELQIEVTIFDIENKLIGKYSSDALKSKTYTALYWGWGISAANDVNKRKIFTECMEDIKRQITKDYSRLYDALK